MSSSSQGRPGAAIDRPTSPNAYIDDERIWLAALALFCALLGCVGLIDAEHRRPLDFPLVAAPPIAVAARLWSAHVRRWWLFPIAAAAPIVLNVPDLRTEGPLFVPIAVATHLALFEPRRWIVRVCAGIVVTGPLMTRLISGTDGWGWPFWTVGAMLSLAFGEIGHRYRARLTELRDAREALADQAVLDERRRIARDVHDLVGHSLSVMMLQITATRELLRTDPDEAEAALDDAAHAGRAGMIEIRETIGLLRSGDGDDTSPAPGLVDIVALVEQYRSAGLGVELVVRGDLAAVDGARSIAGFRIVQEALANASKHGHGPARVDVDVSGGSCVVAVSNPAYGAPNGRPGYGLIGMRERAQSVGGTLIAELRGRTWCVDARLPTGAGDTS